MMSMMLMSMMLIVTVSISVSDSIPNHLMSINFQFNLSHSPFGYSCVCHSICVLCNQFVPSIHLISPPLFSFVNSNGKFIWHNGKIIPRLLPFIPISIHKRHWRRTSKSFYDLKRFERKVHPVVWEHLSCEWRKGEEERIKSLRHSHHDDDDDDDHTITLSDDHEVIHSWNFITQHLHQLFKCVSNEGRSKSCASPSVEEITLWVIDSLKSR